MIRTNVVTLTVIPAIAYRQKLPSGGSGITIYRYDTVQPGIASISKSSGKAIPAANTSRKLFPQAAFSEAIELTAGMPYKKQKGVRVAEEKVVETEEPAEEDVAKEDAAVIDSADYQKIVAKFTDKKGKLSYDLLNRELIKFAKKSAQVRSMIESKATADEISFEIAKAKFREITGNALLSDDQIRKAIELLDEVSPKGVFKELNSEIGTWHTQFGKTLMVYLYQRQDQTYDVKFTLDAQQRAALESIAEYEKNVTTRMTYTLEIESVNEDYTLNHPTVLLTADKLLAACTAENEITVGTIAWSNAYNSYEFTPAPFTIDPNFPNNP